MTFYGGTEGNFQDFQLIFKNSGSSDVLGFATHETVKMRANQKEHVYNQLNKAKSKVWVFHEECPQWITLNKESICE